MTELLYTALTVTVLRETLQAAGYRIGEAPGQDSAAPVLLSATNGLPFEIHLFNPLAKGKGEFADAAFRAAFRVQGELPLALVNGWNVSHRFARLILLDAPDTTDHWLILESDLIALGGVAPANLRAHVEIWDRLVTELLAWLRAELPKLAPKLAEVGAPKVEPAQPAGETAPAPAEAVAVPAV